VRVVLAAACAPCVPGLSDSAYIPVRGVSGRDSHLDVTTTDNTYANWIQESDTRAAQVVEVRIWRRCPHLGSRDPVAGAVGQVRRRHQLSLR